jgi:cobalt-zinc-cadmium efflux system membrane fusion protein
MRSETEAMLSAYGVKMDKSPDPAKVPTGSPLKSPRSGVIIEKTITLGDVVNTTAPLYVVADLSEVWLDINIYDKDIANINIGQPVTFKSDSIAGRTFQGRVNYIQPQAGNGRTFIARAVFQNPTRILKPGMFGQVELSKVSSSMGAYVPDSALEKYNGEDFVFVDKGNGRFEKRKVELADRTSDGYLIRSGLQSGERIVTAGAITLKAELFKNQSGQD